MVKVRDGERLMMSSMAACIRDENDVLRVKNVCSSGAVGKTRFTSPDAAFDYLWINGASVFQMVFVDVLDDLDELRATALNWPNICFTVSGLAVSDMTTFSKNVEFDCLDHLIGYRPRYSVEVLHHHSEN